MALRIAFLGHFLYCIWFIVSCFFCPFRVLSKYWFLNIYNSKVLHVVDNILMHLRFFSNFLIFIFIFLFFKLNLGTFRLLSTCFNIDFPLLLCIHFSSHLIFMGFHFFLLSLRKLFCLSIFSLFSHNISFSFGLKF